MWIIFKLCPYIFPKCENKKRVAKVTYSDTLDLNTSFREEKDKNSFLIDKTIKLEAENVEVKQSLSITTSKLDNVKLNLKRTAGREKYCLRKIQKLEGLVKCDCCKLKISQLECEIEKKDRKIRELEENVEYLQDLLTIHVIQRIRKMNLLSLMSKLNNTPLN